MRLQEQGAPELASESSVSSTRGHFLCKPRDECNGQDEEKQTATLSQPEPVKGSAEDGDTLTPVTVAMNWGLMCWPSSVSAWPSIAHVLLLLESSQRVPAASEESQGRDVWKEGSISPSNNLSTVTPKRLWPLYFLINDGVPLRQTFSSMQQKSLKGFYIF